MSSDAFRHGDNPKSAFPGKEPGNEPKSKSTDSAAHYNNRDLALPQNLFPEKGVITAQVYRRPTVRPQLWAVGEYDQRSPQGHLP